MRRTHTDYLDDPAYLERHIFNLPTAAAVYRGDNDARVALSEYRYDTYEQQPLADAPGVEMHSASHNPYSSGFDPRTLRRGNLTQITRYADAASPIASGPVTELRSYDITGNLVSRSGTCCVNETIRYSANYQYAYPTESMLGDPDPSGSVRVTSSATYDFNTGLLLNTRDALGREIWRTYDPISLRPTTIAYPTIPSSGSTPIRRFLYTEGAELVVDESFEHTVNRWQTDVAEWTRTYFNGLGRPWRASVFAQGRWNHSDARYDARGRVSQQSLPFDEGDSSPPWQSFEYDALGRLTRSVAPDGRDVQRIVYNETQTPERVQDRLGQTTRTIDAWGRERWTRADSLGRLAEVIEPDPSGSGSVFEPGHMSTQYYYNALDQVSEIEHGAQWHGYVYDSLGRLIRQRLPEKDWTLNEAGQFIGGGRSGIFSDVFAYDSRGNLVSHVDARGIRTIYDYRDDPLNRLQEVRYDGSGFGDNNNPFVPASDARYDYESGGDLTRLRAVITDNVAEEYACDPQGRLSTKRIRWSNQQNAPAQFDYTYDVFDRLTDIRYPAQTGAAGSPRSVVHVDFSAGGVLSQLSINGETYARALSYSPNGALRDLTVGSGATPLTESYDYDRNYNLLVGQRVSREASPLLNLSYDYARDGRVTGQLASVVNNLDGAALQNRTYGYDSLGRLISSFHSGPAEREALVHRYEYDGNGNRTRSRAYRCVRGFSCALLPTAELPADWRDGIDGITYAAESNRITNPGFAYDAAGNLRRGQRSDGSWQNYQYDAAGRRALVTDNSGTVLERNHYGDSRQRVSVETRIEGTDAFRTTYYVWNGDQVLAEFRADPASGGQMSWAQNYAYLGNRLLATQSAGGTRLHHPDRLGTRLITDANGAVVSQQNPFSFGTERETPPADSSSRRFASYDRSAATGLDYAVNRYYAADQGRFLQPDPLGLAAAGLADPQSLNLYAYVRNDPVNGSDPLGLLDQESCETYNGVEYCGQLTIVTAPSAPPYIPQPDPDANAREAARNSERGRQGGGGGEHPLQRQARERYEHSVRCNNGRRPEYVSPGASWSQISDMFATWLFQGGVDTTIFTGNTPQVIDMQTDPSVASARNYFYGKNAANLRSGRALEPVTGYIGSFGITGAIRAGTNPTRQFVGSFDINIHPTDRNEIMFILRNLTSRESGLYRIPVYNPTRSEASWGGNQTQFYTWTEPLRVQAACGNN